MENSRFRFRAWDSLNKRMILSPDLYRPNNKVIECELNQWIADLPAWITLMQYTGLKDKNGKEIYEGDIIQECEVGDKIWDDDAEVTKCPIGVVEFYAPCFNVCQKVVGEAMYFKQEGGSQLHLSLYDGFFQWGQIESYKVIGNIYENPELLEAK